MILAFFYSVMHTKVLAAGAPELRAWGEEVNVLLGKLMAKMQVTIS